MSVVASTVTVTVSADAAATAPAASSSRKGKRMARAFSIEWKVNRPKLENRMRHLSFLLLCAASAFAQAPSAAPAAQPPAAAREPGLYAVITTSMGPITVKLFEKEAPVTVKNFIDLAKGRKSWKDQKTGQMVRRPLY